MAKAKFDIKTVQTQALEAAVGATDLAVGVVRSSVADLQKRLADVQKNVGSFEPQAFVSTSVESLTKDAKARRAAIEKLVAALQAEALAVPTRVQGTATDTYADLVKRGEILVGRIRRQPSTEGHREVRRDDRHQGQDHQDPGCQGGQEDHHRRQAEHHRHQEAHRCHPQQRQGDHHLGPQDRLLGGQRRRGRCREGRRLIDLRHHRTRSP